MTNNITDEDRLKQKVQTWIVSISALILVGKFGAYWLTHSVGVLTDALESIVNVVAELISLFSLRWAAQPRDKEHPFGHGKMELLSASIEGMLIIVAGGIIVYEGIRRLFVPTEIASLDIGIIVIAASAVVNYLMGWRSIQLGRKYSSIALVAGGKHLQSDTYSAVGLVAGLVCLLLFPEQQWIDSLLALIFGSIILIAGVKIIRKTSANLLDKADEALISDLAQTINEHREPEWIDIHNTKVIKYGSHIYIDCDLTIPWWYNIEEGHASGDKLKRLLTDKYGDKVQMTIHLDPCNIFAHIRCAACGVGECSYRQIPFKARVPILLKNIVETGNEKNE